MATAPCNQQSKRNIKATNQTRISVAAKMAKAAHSIAGAPWQLAAESDGISSNQRIKA